MKCEVDEKDVQDEWEMTGRSPLSHYFFYKEKNNVSKSNQAGNRSGNLERGLDYRGQRIMSECNMISDQVRRSTLYLIEKIKKTFLSKLFSFMIENGLQ